MLRFRRFQEADFAAYAPWFADPELARRLGPLDAAWLAAVPTEGETWAVFRGGQLVAVAEAELDEAGQRAAITGLAVKPELRGQGLGGAVLEELLGAHRRRGVLEHRAFIAADNEAAQRCFERAGFALRPSAPSAEGYLEVRRSVSRAGVNSVYEPQCPRYPRPDALRNAL